MSLVKLFEDWNVLKPKYRKSYSDSKVLIENNAFFHITFSESYNCSDSGYSTLKIVADLITSKSGPIILKEAANTYTVNSGREAANFA